MTPSETQFCPSCETYQGFHRETQTEEYDVRGQKVEIELPVCVCESCQETWTDESYEGDPVAAIFAKYREQKGLLTPNEIRDVREQYKLSQKSFAILLGMGEVTINRYERGALQDDAHDNMIRLYSNPENMADLMTRRGNLLSQPQRKRAAAALRQMGAGEDTLPRLWQRLHEAGMNRAYLRKTLLPDWWEDLKAELSGSFRRAIALLSELLGVDMETLQDAKRLPPPAAACRLKARKGVAPERLEWPVFIATRAAALAAQGVPMAPMRVPAKASEIRDSIMGDGAKCVNLDNLLDYCWSRGIPVLHVTEYPSGSKKMDGLATLVDGRPVIIVSKNIKQPAWPLFIVAHELGHIACGHVQPDGDPLVDTKVDDESSEPLEQEANRFAIELLTGHPETQYRHTGHWLTGAELADAARLAGEKGGVDAGHIALNYAKGQKHYAVGNKALNILHPNADAPKLMRDMTSSYLEWDELSDETSGFLRRLAARSQRLDD